MRGAGSLLLSGLQRSKPWEWLLLGPWSRWSQIWAFCLILARGLDISHGGAEGRSQSRAVDVRGFTAPTSCSQAEQQCKLART